MSLLLEDRALLDGFRKGEEDALTRVYEAYSDDVARYLASGAFLGGGNRLHFSPLDVEAAHQETFVRAFRADVRASYDGLRPYKPYLLTIARSVAISLLRSQGKLSRESVSMHELPQVAELPVDAPGPEEHALYSEIRNVVSSFLSRLGQGDQELARIRFMDGCSQERTAEELRLTRSEVRTREHRLRKAFTRYLSSNGLLEKGRPLV